MKKKPSGLALLPFVVFVGLYLFVGLFLTFKGDKQGFYAMPASISVIVGIIVAFIIYRGSIEKKFNALVKGCGEDNIIIMCLIFLLAGAFGTVTEKIGGVDSTVNLGLSLVPIQFLVPGMFLISCFVCLAIGTSMGTIATIAPICVTLADKTGISMALLLAALLCGAIFGNNMSVIADTGIVITRILNIKIKDKFKVNIKITGPALIVAVILFFIFGTGGDVTQVTAGNYSIMKILPYIFVLVIALIGVNVFVVLTFGTLFAGAIGIIYGDFSILKFTGYVQDGFVKMFDVLLFSLLVGGLAYMVKEEGGIDWINEKLKKFIVGKKSAQAVAMVLPGTVDIALANDTVTGLVTGPIVKDMSDNYDIDRRKMGSLMHTTVVVLQSTLPYGAQILLATSIAGGKVSPVQVIPYLWYGYLALFFAVLSIFIPFAEAKTKLHFSKKSEDESADKVEEAV